MTSKSLIEKKEAATSHLLSALCLILAILMIALGKNLKTGIYNGLIFSFSTIIPTLFPFFILSDLWSSVFYIKPDGKPAKAFERVFGINGHAISAVLSGFICGFPVGVKTATELYRSNKISKDDLEHLSGFVNNPSLAFVISGVGAGMLSDIRVGILLYFSILISSFLTGIIFRGKQKQTHFSQDNSRQRFDLVYSIKSAGIASVNLASCIVFFSGVIGMLSPFVLNQPTLALLSSFLEISNATNLIIKCDFAHSLTKLPLLAFSLGFSGFSVHIQAFSLLPPEVSRIKYLLMKLTQGILSALSIILFHALSK